MNFFLAEFTATLYVVYVDTVEHNGQCTCEMCQPNWHMGWDGEFTPTEPVEAAPEPATVLEQHRRKLRAAYVNTEGMVFVEVR